VLTDDSKDLLRTIANTLAEVHNQPVESGISTANAVKRSQREIFINPQTTIDTLANFPKDHPLFGALTGKYAYLEKMLRTIDYWADFADSIPCVPLHGDFWSANILEESNGAIFLIDYSRIPFGDPSIDVGTFLGAHLIFDGIIKKSRVHFEAARYFVEQYLLKRNTPDATLIQRIPMVLFWIAIIRIYPPVYGNLPEKHMHEFAAYIDMCYRNRDDILNYDLCASALFDMEKPRMQM
jgi:thiamine kinase-like enzyme